MPGHPLRPTEIKELDALAAVVLERLLLRYPQYDNEIAKLLARLGRSLTGQNNHVALCALLLLVRHAIDVADAGLEKILPTAKPRTDA